MNSIEPVWARGLVHVLAIVRIVRAGVYFNYGTSNVIIGDKFTPSQFCE